MRTVNEWLQAFNLMYNNIASDKAPGLEPYEISMFLTAAQNAVVVSLYKGELNGDAFESTEEITSYLGTLVEQATLAECDEDVYRVCGSSYLYRNPEDLLFRTLESCKITTQCGDEQVPVVPVTQDEYWRTVRNPFKRQNRRRVLRLSYSVGSCSEGTASEKGYTELISSYPIFEYTVRYMKKPEPIVLENLSDGLSIDGKTQEMPCLLPEALHQTILVKAVEIAKATWNA